MVAPICLNSNFKLDCPSRNIPQCNMFGPGTKPKNRKLAQSSSRSLFVSQLVCWLVHLYKQVYLPDFLHTYLPTYNKESSNSSDIKNSRTLVKVATAVTVLTVVTKLLVSQTHTKNLKKIHP